jgi:hypothetical protein
MAKRKARARQRIGYRRFSTAAEAMCFVVERFPAIGRAALGEAESQLAVVLRDSDMIHARRANEQEGN